jgi:predicted SprT family Zn-dependent metalloprotease
MDRNHYQAKLESRLLRLWAKACNIWPELEGHEMPAITIDARIRRAIAYYYPERHEIRISWYWAQCDKNHVILREIVAHETAHHIDEVLNGEKSSTINEGHGPQWQKIMVQLGLNPLTHYSIK